MTDIQKTLLTELLQESYKHGFGTYYPLADLAKKHGLTREEVYDGNTETGILMEWGPKGIGCLDVLEGGRIAAISMDMRESLENWTGFRYC